MIMVVKRGERMVRMLIVGVYRAEELVEGGFGGGVGLPSFCDHACGVGSGL